MVLPQTNYPMIIYLNQETMKQRHVMLLQKRQITNRLNCVERKFPTWHMENTGMQNDIGFMVKEETRG